MKTFISLAIAFCSLAVANGQNSATGNPPAINPDSPALQGYLNTALLPITWGGFTAQKQGSRVVLNWGAIYDENNRDFYIQRSFDGEKWSTIGQQPVSASIHKISSYTFNDNSPAYGNIFYRVFQPTMLDDSCFSKIVHVYFDLGVQTVEVLGNPVSNGQLRLQLKQAATISVYSLDGHLVTRSQFAAGIQTLDMSHCSKGTYFIANGLDAQKLLVQ